MSAGDVLLVAGESDWQSRIIRAGTHSHWTHCALVMSADNRLLAEATQRGIAFADMAKYDHKETRLIGTGLTADQRVAACRFASSCIGQRYGFGQIASIMLAWATGKRLYFGMEGAEDCASYCARALEHAGTILGKGPELYRPGDFALLFDVTPRISRGRGMT